ncbi:hypothetical protein NLM27_17705 [Bradyrhizobium sp. CCGB12]|uniref:hypothetical protein n=1 Tax=Bradyrhizobium sp. CCGB12 TaxID=2949632 RepID=UPI0020B26386|nr:hypothetical protein [Bradyrhizobium sp. CCGB12]MCP3390617.1 hypothetical protein [Bradyrhizobium sp. CCGB12]
MRPSIHHSDSPGSAKGQVILGEDKAACAPLWGLGSRGQEFFIGSDFIVTRPRRIERLKAAFRDNEYAVCANGTFTVDISKAASEAQR